jgi:multiple sugar transport system permease protein
MNKVRLKLKLFTLCVPAFAGFALFFGWPFGKTVWYSLINDVFNKRFIFLGNYFTVMNNDFYRLALKNTLIFSVIGVSLLVLVSLTLSIGLSRLDTRLRFMQSAFIAPMLLPTAGIIFTWQMFFMNDTYFLWMRDGAMTPFFQILPIYLLFIWKNTGINVILLTAALTQIPGEVLEAAALDGAKSFRLYRSMIIPLITPSLFFVFVLSFVNSLRIFRESYLFYNTNYPPDPAYTVQYYMNNHFFKLNYQNLSTGVVIFTLIVALVIFAAYRVENKMIRNVF